MITKIHMTHVVRVFLLITSDERNRIECVYNSITRDNRDIDRVYISVTHDGFQMRIFHCVSDYGARQ